MTAEHLIAEGRRLQRPCAFLRPQGTGPVSAVWHEPDDEEIASTQERCWLTVDARMVPGPPLPAASCLSVFTDEETCEGGRVESAPWWPKRPGTKLYAHTASVLPPLEAVFARGSEAVGEWLRACGWDRTQRYSGGFKDAAIAREYIRAWMAEFPLYFKSDIYAVLGGWHFPGPDDDWYDLVDESLVVLTVRDSEPWVEAWWTRTERFKVIQRIT